MEVIKIARTENLHGFSEELIDAYSGLEKLGYLHSVEVYQKANFGWGFIWNYIQGSILRRINVFKSTSSFKMLSSKIGRTA